VCGRLYALELTAGLSQPGVVSNEARRKESFVEPHRLAELTKILVVEDHAELRALIATRFRRAGFRVVEAANGLEAVACLEDDARVGAIVLDLQMPVMTGWEVIAACRAHPTWRRIPIVVVTALRPPHLPLEMLHDIPVITKPFMPEDLLEAVRRAMATRPLPFCGALEK